MSLTVQHVPAGHPYARSVRPLDGAAAPDVEFWPDPPVPGAAEGVWWPPRALDPAWIAEHRPDVLHVHFGFEHFTPEQLRAALDAQHAHGGAVVVTVHDLQNPHLQDQDPHRARLRVLLDAADAVITLTPGAAAAVEAASGRAPLVLPHPHVVPLDALPDDGAADGERPGVDRPARLLMHAKDLRAQVDPVGLLPVLAAARDALAARGLAVEVTVDVQDGVRDEAALAELEAGAEAHGFALWRHARLDDAELHAALRDADVSVLPYRVGTHSGWVEMCRDLGVPVAVAEVGHIADQARAWTTPELLAAFDPDDPASLADALAALLTAAPDARAAAPAARAAQRRRVAAAHVAVYRQALAVRRGTAATVSVLVITGHRDAHLARVLAGLERSHRRPDQVVVVFMGQPDGAVPATDLPVTVGHVAADHGLPLATARNRAAELATGEVLVFLDVDCIPAADTVGVLAAEVAAHPGSLVMGAPRYLAPDWTAALAAEGVDADAAPTDGDLRRHAVPHRARTHLRPGPSEEWALVWTLVMAIGAADLARIDGFDEGFAGYGAEDTDLAFRARDAGLTLRISPAEAFHQHHGVHRPPLHHVADIVVNARRFRTLHGTWPMGGWLAAFAERGLIRWDPDGDLLELVREPTPDDVAAARVDDAAY
ncbi:glycosyltransferase [Micrococcus porci]|uniref:glycosyltransferase n=1 Tax=Micrococcus porci TaxID=2856555 RepID=UPI001CCCC934|nr:galactosyltransferase-related protein [Micrococcus porci]UBH25395.1 glycosyltransferase [Micrococcus porci]